MEQQQQKIKRNQLGMGDRYRLMRYLETSIGLFDTVETLRGAASLGLNLDLTETNIISDCKELGLQVPGARKRSSKGASVADDLYIVATRLAEVMKALNIPVDARLASITTRKDRRTTTHTDTQGAQQ